MADEQDLRISPPFIAAPAVPADELEKLLLADKKIADARKRAERATKRLKDLESARTERFTKQRTRRLIAAGAAFEAYSKANDAAFLYMVSILHEFTRPVDRQLLPVLVSIDKQLAADPSLTRIEVEIPHGVEPAKPNTPPPERKDAHGRMLCAVRPAANSAKAE